MMWDDSDYSLAGSLARSFVCSCVRKRSDERAVVGVGVKVHRQVGTWGSSRRIIREDVSFPSNPSSVGALDCPWTSFFGVRLWIGKVLWWDYNFAWRRGGYEEFVMLQACTDLRRILTNHRPSWALCQGLVGRRALKHFSIL